MYCFKCSKLRQALFNEIGKEESILWTCVHRRIAIPGVNMMMALLSNLEKKVEGIEKKVNEPKELQKTDKDLIREVIREEKEEEAEREQRKLNLIIHAMPESNKGTLEDRKQDDCEKVQAILMDTLNLEVDIEMF